MVEPLDETLRGLGPGKRRLNKKVVVGAAVAGALAVAGVLWPEHLPLFQSALRLLGF